MADLHGGSITELVKGVKEIAAFVFSLPENLTLCDDSIQGDIKLISDWGSTLENPLSMTTAIATHMIPNSVEIFSTLTQFQTDYLAKEYYKSGNDISNVLTLALGKPHKPSLLDMLAAQMSKGAAAQQSNFEIKKWVPPPQKTEEQIKAEFAARRARIAELEKEIHGQI